MRALQQLACWSYAVGTGSRDKEGTRVATGKLEPPYRSRGWGSCRRICYNSWHARVALSGYAFGSHRRMRLNSWRAVGPRVVPMQVRALKQLVFWSRVTWIGWGPTDMAFFSIVAPCKFPNSYNFISLFFKNEYFISAYLDI